MISKVKGGYVIKHCRGGGRIAATKKPVSHAKAKAIHGAIMANKKKRGGG